MSCFWNYTNKVDGVYLDTGNTLGPEGEEEEDGGSSPPALGLLPALLWGSSAWKSGLARLQQTE